MPSIEFPLSFKRQFTGPLDESSVYSTLADLNNYVDNDPIAYVGQVLAVSSGSDAGLYLITDDSGSKVVTKLGEGELTSRLDDTISVYGAGTSKVNGIYKPNGVNGYTLYDTEGNELHSIWYYSSGATWIISDAINDLGSSYYSAATLASAIPPESGWVVAVAGTSPAPSINLETVSQHTHRAEEIYGIDFASINRLDDTVSVYGAGDKNSNGIYVRNGSSSEDIMLIHCTSRTERLFAKIYGLILFLLGQILSQSGL